MIHHDLTDWPLVITVVRGPMTLAEHSGFLAEWKRWLDRGERFATLRLFADEEALVYPRAAASDAKAWLKSHAAQVRTQVLGISTVAPAEHLDRVIRMNTEQSLGVPAEAFGHINPALNFLSWFIAPPEGVSWNRAALCARLRECLPEPRTDPTTS